MTFLIQTAPAAQLVNCRAKLDKALRPFVLGEDGIPESASLLVRGWYVLQVSPGSSLWVAQINPSWIVDTNAVAHGHYVTDKFEFFVESSLIDGALVVQQCLGTPLVCNQQELTQLAWINRTDTVMPMSVTGDTESADVSRPPPAPDNVCGKVS